MSDASNLLPLPGRCWRLDAFLAGDGEPVDIDVDEKVTGYRLGDIYVFLRSPDYPPRFTGFHKPTGEFLGLRWTEVPDPRTVAKGEKRP